MISSELLRRYPFFGPFNEIYLRDVAMISEEIRVEKGKIVIEEGKKVEYLYLITSGGIDLSYKSEHEFHPKSTKVLPVGEISPGEIFGISAIIEPHVSTSTATASKDTSLVRINATKLHELMKDCNEFGCIIMKQIAIIAMERLNFTRIQLAAAWT